MIRVSLIALALFVPLQSAAVAGTYACKVWCEGRGGVVRARLGSIDVQAPDSGAAQEAAKQQIEDFHCHILTDLDVENGVNHFLQMMDMDIVCIGTHGKGGLFHHSATEKLINHLYKPILSFHLN